MEMDIEVVSKRFYKDISENGIIKYCFIDRRGREFCFILRDRKWALIEEDEQARKVIIRCYMSGGWGGECTWAQALDLMSDKGIEVRHKPGNGTYRNREECQYDFNDEGLKWWKHWFGIEP